MNYLVSLKVVNPERWERTKSFAWLACFLGMIASIGGLEGRPDVALPNPFPFIVCVAGMYLIGVSLKPRP
jgi:hypothetical protein